MKVSGSARVWARTVAGLFVATTLVACGGGGSSSKAKSSDTAASSKSDNSSSSTSGGGSAKVADAALDDLVKQWFDGQAANSYAAVVGIVGPQLAAEVATFAALDTLDSDADKWKIPPTTILSLKGNLKAAEEDHGIVTAKGPLEVIYADTPNTTHTYHDFVFDASSSQLKLVDYTEGTAKSVAQRSLAPGIKTVPVGKDGTISVYSGYEFPAMKGLVNQLDYVFEVRSNSEPIVIKGGNDALVLTPDGLPPIAKTGAWNGPSAAQPQSSTYIGYFFQSDGGVPDFGATVSLTLVVGGADQTVTLDIPPFTTYDGTPTTAHDVLDAAPTLSASSSS